MVLAHRRPFASKRVSDRLIEIGVVSATLGSVLAVPCLVVVGFLGLARTQRYLLPHWRSVVGLSSFALTFLGWLLFVGALLFPSLLDLSSRGIYLTADMDRLHIAALCTALPGTVLAMALRRAPRICALIAGLLQLVLGTMMVFA